MGNLILATSSVHTLDGRLEERTLQGFVDRTLSRVMVEVEEANLTSYWKTTYVGW